MPEPSVVTASTIRGRAVRSAMNKKAFRLYWVGEPEGPSLVLSFEFSVSGWFRSSNRVVLPEEFETDSRAKTRNSRSKN